MNPPTPNDGQTHVDPQTELSVWWHLHAQTEIDATVPKAIEYGAHDLIEMGRMLLQTMGHTCNTGCLTEGNHINAYQGITDEHAAEVGVWFYTLGKMARWNAAIRRGQRVSDDTLFDLGVYAKMAQRIRTHGTWPGVNLETTKEQQ